MDKIAITMGDPSGVGPEIIVSLLNGINNDQLNELVIIGNLQILNQANNLLGKKIDFKKIDSHLEIIDVKSKFIEEVKPKIISRGGGEAAYRCFEKAIKMGLNNEISAIVTAPLCKKALHDAGHFYDGHTEILKKLTNANETFMLLSGGLLNTVHVSTHLSLLNAIKSLTTKRIIKTIEIVNQHFIKMYQKQPLIAVPGLNPHSGENGIFGDEEQKIIIPAIEYCKNKSVKVFGPISPDTVFYRALNGEFDVVVALYHDQGHIPTKLISFEESVNVTLGTPLVRTSVDHGTAHEIAWEGKASSKNLLAAINYAKKMIRFQ